MAVPGSAEFQAELAARRDAAEAKLSKSRSWALCVTLWDAKALCPDGIECATLQPWIDKLLPGCNVESVDLAREFVYVHLDKLPKGEK